jgi:hypothetical protein
MAQSESDRLVMIMEECSEVSLEEYATPGDAFFDQPLHSFVIDEVHAMTRELFCRNSSCMNPWNPLYLFAFCGLFVLTLPGALLHWVVISYVPVRATEDTEEREFRCNGIYTAMGCALFGLPYSIVGVVAVTDTDGGADRMLLTVHTVSLYVYLCALLFCLGGLKGMAHQLHRSTRTFIVGAWLVDVLLIALLLCDAQLLSSQALSHTLKVGVILEFCCELLAVFVSTVVARQATLFWNAYETFGTKMGRKHVQDLCLSGTLVLLGVGLVVGLGALIYVSSRSSWGLE